MTKARKPARQQTNETGVQEAAELKEEIHKTKGILDAIGDGITILDRNFTILYENRVHRKIMGDHTGEHCYWAYQKRQRVCKGCPVALTFSDGGIHKVKREGQNEKGKVYVEVTASPLRDNQGNIIAGIETVRDITTREETERALRIREKELETSNEKYRDLVENLSEVVYSANMKGIITYVSPVIEFITGYTPSEIIGRNFTDFLVNGDKARGRKLYKRVLAGNLEPNEYRIFTKSGSMGWIRVSSRPMYEGNRVIGLHGMLSDITEIKKAEGLRAESEIRLRSIIDNLPFDFFLIDKSGRYVMQNAMCRQHWGNLTGKQPEDLAPDETTLALWQDNNRRAFAGETVKEEVSFSVLGTRRYYYNIISPIRYGDNIQHIIVMNVDIGKLKEAEASLRNSEEKFRSLAEKSPNMIFINYKGKVVYVNHKCEEIMGYTRKDFYKDNFDFRSLIAPEYQKLISSAFQSHMQGQEVPPYEYAILAKDGRRLEVIITTKLIDYENDRAILGIITDITERKRNESILQKREKELEVKSQNLEELNTALQVLLKKREEDKVRTEEKISSNIKELIRPYLDKIKNGTLDETQKIYVRIIESNLNEITSPFTLRLSSEHLHLTPTEIKVANLISQGKTSKEIADLVNSSPKAVSFHRGNIRKKLGLQHKKANLQSYLRANFITR